MKNLRELIIAVLLMWLVATFFLNNGVKTKIDQLEREKAKLNDQLDSVTVLQRETALHYMKAATELNTANQQIANERNLRVKEKKEYEADKKRYSAPLTDSDINSAVDRLVKNY